MPLSQVYSFHYTSLDLESWHAFLKRVWRYSFDRFMFFLLCCKMQIKLCTVSQYFSKSSPGFLSSSSHNGNLPTTTCLSFSSSFHPATNHCHCLPALPWNTIHLTFAYRASQLASTSSKSFSGLLQRNWWLGERLHGFAWQFLCLSK